ncbi:MAG: PAS domain S-box protein [Cyclobacteriaceae bacterium]
MGSKFKNHITLSAVFGAVIVMLTLITGLVGYWVWLDVHKDRYRDLTYVASVIDRYNELNYYQRELSLRSVGERMLDIKGEDRHRKRYDFANKQLNIYGELLAFGLADLNGQLTTFTGTPSQDSLPSLTTSEESRRSFLSARNAEGIVIGETYFFEDVDSWIVPIRVPITNDTGEVVAVNTSAIDYESIVTNFESFGFDSEYQVHVVNADFNTTQVYHPLATDRFKDLLRGDADIYEIADSMSFDGWIMFEGINLYSGIDVIGVKGQSNDYNQLLIVSVRKSILLETFWDTFRFILLVYALITSISVLIFRYVIRKELQHKNALKEERDYSANVIKGSPSLIVGIGTDGNCTFINDFAQDVTGYSADELVGSPYWSILYPGDLYDQVEKLFKKFEDGDEVANYEMVLQSKRGDHRVVAWGSMSIHDQSGNLVEVVGFGTDVTELKAAQKELDHYTENLEKLVDERTNQLAKVNHDLYDSNEELTAQRETLEATLEELKQAQSHLIQSEKMASLGVLVAGVGHEINNPLNFIKGGVNGIEHALDQKQYSDLNEYLDVINEGVKRVSGIVASLSHFSRQGMTMDEDCDIHQIIDNCLTILHNNFKHKIEVVKNYCNETLIIQGNEGKLHQAFLNILANAEQAIEETGKVVITTKLNESSLMVTIEDDGVGIPKELLNKVIDPFFTTKDPGKGTGLGLPLTLSIFEEHKGKSIISSEVNKKTTFSVNFHLDT